MSIQRFKWVTEDRPVFVCMGCDEEGGWVQYDAHTAEVARLQAENDALAHRVLRYLDDKANAAREIESLNRQLKAAQADAEHWKPYRIARDFDRAGDRTLCVSVFFSEAALNDIKDHDDARDFVRRALADVPDKAVRAARGDGGIAL